MPDFPRLLYGHAQNGHKKLPQIYIAAADEMRSIFAQISSHSFQVSNDLQEE